MPLVKSVLKGAIDAIQKTQPKSVEDASTKWAAAIFGYSSVALAGVTAPTLNVASLASAFLSSMKGQTWMDDLGTNLLNFWSPAPWVGPGFTGVTVPPSPMDSHALGEKLKAAKKEDDVADIIATEIDNWTKTIQVTLTNTSSGATSSAPVS